MRLLIIRHGDPDYSIDSLTEKGLARGRAFIREDLKARRKSVLLLAFGQSEGHRQGHP